MGRHTTQPIDGVATVWLGGEFETYGVNIVPYELGTDAYNNHYFQLAEINLVASGHIPVEPLNSGVACKDTAVGVGYLMYTEESVHTRFQSYSPHPENANHFACIRPIRLDRQGHFGLLLNHSQENSP